MLGYAFTDTAVFGRQYDQQQWAHAFGVSLLPARTADDVDELGNLLTWQTGAAADRRRRSASSCRRRSSSSPGCTSPGPSSPRRRSAPGSFRFPPAATTVPTRLHLSWGDHDIWKGDRPHRRRRRHRDLVGPRRQPGPDEVGRDGTGLYRYADDGARYLPGQVAHGARRAVRRRDVDGRARHELPPADHAAELPVARRVGADRSDARPVVRPALDVPADHARRVADRDAEVGQRAGDDRARADHDVATDVGAREHDGAVAEPRPGADASPGAARANCWPIGSVTSS